MALYDAIIIGSGPAGVAAAHTLKDKKIAMLDVGNKPAKSTKMRGNFYDIIRKSAESYFDELIGQRYESLNNIDKEYIMPKVKAPCQRYVVENADIFGSIKSKTFSGFTSYAQGGLANAWGAQLYRFNEDDLRHFPIGTSDLEPYYDRLTGLIGICGQEDDLSRYYGPARNTLEPLQLNTLGKDLLKKYTKKRTYFNEKGVSIGRPRLAVLSADYNKRKQCDYSNLEFFKPGIEYLYTPSITLNELIENGLPYKPGHLVLKYKEDRQKVTIETRNIHTNQIETFEAKKIILAAGTLGTARIVLNSNDDFQARLPLMENLLSYIPFLNPFKVGSRQEKRSFYTQLNMFYEGHLHNGPIMGTFYAITGILHSDVLFDMPLSVRSNITASKYVLPAMLVLHLWYPAQIKETNYVTLDKSRDLHISYSDNVTGEVEQHLIKSFRRIGYLSAPSLCKYPLPGNSFHYAGTLPMRTKPTSRYETNTNGKLYGTNHVYVADGACFPYLPAKNLSFTIMANAMRIAEHLNKEIQKTQ